MKFQENEKTPQLLVVAKISDTTVSKSGNPAFAVTLKAIVVGCDSIMIDPQETLLQPNNRSALGYAGLTFQDAYSGELIARMDGEKSYCEARRPSVANDSSQQWIEIPAASTNTFYSVTHTFISSPIMEPDLELERFYQERFEKRGITAQSSEKAKQTPETDQLAGFEVGHEYHIGLGNQMRTISKWRHKTDTSSRCFGARWKRNVEQEELINKMPELEMTLVNKASFTVVE